ncbi:MAG: hypothetical protein M1821_001707 [Bathelium mastoideum]|nr:MAG: hypothetical protein M1821_001707 [Bathelium mastoideum]
MTSNANLIRDHAKKSHAPYARTSRPGPLIQRRSYNKYHHKVGQGPSRSNAATQKTDDDEDDAMATSFLQFCCRKKDQTMSYITTFYPDQTPPPTPLSSAFTFDELPIHDILPQRSPTSRRSLSLAPSEETSASEDDNSSNSSSTRSHHHRHHHHNQHQHHYDSEAARYLRQFQSTNTLHSLRHAPHPHPHPAHLRRAATNSSSNMPSLANTPTSSASNSTPTTPATLRPLPPRANPSVSSVSWGARGIDLVLPVTAYPLPLPPPTASTTTATTATTAAPAVVARVAPKRPAETGSSPDAVATASPPSRGASAVASSPASSSAEMALPPDGVLNYAKQLLLPKDAWGSAAGGGHGSGSLKELLRVEEAQTRPKRPVWGSTGHLPGMVV